MATIIRVDGSEESLEDTSLESLQKAVGGYIEILASKNRQLLVVDEEGKLKGKTPNTKATIMLPGRGIIVGDVVLASHREIRLMK